MTDGDAAMPDLFHTGNIGGSSAVLPSVFPGGNKGHQREGSLVLKRRKCVVGKNDKKWLRELK